ncbi:MAG: hypothetical protein JRH15_20675, partial [Deltaproteobacteria bacterium]|nr:hypothetical protein [Deltaproteobacteria bacterium]
GPESQPTVNAVKGGLSITEYVWEAYKRAWALAIAVGVRGDIMRSAPFSHESAEFQFRGFYDKTVESEFDAEIRQEAEKISGTDKVMDIVLPDGKPELVIYNEDSITINDCLSACKITGIGWHAFRTWNDTYRAKLFSAGTGIETSVNDLRLFAKRVRNLERAYDVRLGLTREMETLPKRFLEKPLRGFEGEPKTYPPVTEKVLEEMKDVYYKLRGWDVGTGIPTRETLEAMDLTEVAEDLEKEGRQPAAVSA